MFEPKEEYVCLECESVVTPKMKMPGSWAVELVLWLFFIIPGLIYSAWRGSARKRVCPECGSDRLVPVSSVAGRRMMLKTA